MPQNHLLFLKLLEKYQQGKASAEEKKWMDLWFDALSDEEKSHLSASEDIKNEMWSVIEQGMSGENTPLVAERPKTLTYIFVRMAAASVLFLMAFFGYQTYKNHKTVILGVENRTIRELQLVRNQTKVPKLVILNDKSTVQLEPGASLYYPSSFGDTARIVYLSGNAFFEITPDKAKPFFVQSNNLITRVLGTSFTIRENVRNKSTEVSVLTGVVEVKSAKDSDRDENIRDKVVLTPNKKVVFYDSQDMFVEGLVDKPVIIPTVAKEQISFDFKEKRVKEIIPVLEKAYGVSIQPAVESIGLCRLTANLESENTLYTQLEILCAAIDATYKTEKDVIVLYGTGCKPSLNTNP